MTTNSVKDVGCGTLGLSNQKEIGKTLQHINRLVAILVSESKNAAWEWYDAIPYLLNYRVWIWYSTGLFFSYQVCYNDSKTVATRTQTDLQK